MKPRNISNRGTRVLWCAGLLGGLQLMLAQPAGTGTPGAPGIPGIGGVPTPGAVPTPGGAPAPGGVPATGGIPGIPTPQPGAGGGTGMAPLPGTGLPGGAGMAPLPGTGLPGIGIPTAPTIDPSTGQPISGGGLPGMGTGGIPGSGGGPSTTALPGTGGPGTGSMATNQISPQAIAAMMAEAMAVIQAEAKLIQAEANGKFTEEVKLDKWAKKDRQTRQQHNLGVLYTMGVGMPLNFRSAYKWFKLAADEGLPQAQLNVGIALQSGMGTPKDFVGAYKYYTLAAASGLPTAASARDNLAQYLSQFQIRAGARMAHGFKERHDAKMKYIEDRMKAERELYELLGRRPPDSN